MPPTPVIELTSLTKRYGATTAVSEVDLVVEQGEFITLLGPSGCGKTTTLRVIGGFEYPDEGSVRLSGEDVTSIPPFKRRVNTVFQRYALFPHMSVTDNIAYGLRAVGVSAADRANRVREMIGLVELDGMENRKPRELSGGQQQRVALARALAPRPEVLLLDEPLGALDYQMRKHMQFELKEIHQRLGTTFVYVTHDQEEALAMSDRICVMKAGTISQDGSPEEIYQSPANRYVAEFVGNINFLDGTLTGDGHLSVAGLGEYESVDMRHARPGTVTVGVRHEDVEVTPAADGNATCTETLLLGAISRVSVRLDSGQRLVADVPASRAIPSREQPVRVIVAGSAIKTFSEAP